MAVALLSVVVAWQQRANAPASRAGQAAEGCLGESAPLVVDRQMPFAQVAVDGRSAFFVLDFGATVSSLSPAAFADPPRPQPGSPDRYAAFDFFGPWGAVRLPSGPPAPATDRVRQAGILGTDFLASHIYTLDYAQGRLYRAAAGRFCGDEQLRAAGFRALSTQGHYAPQPSQLSCPQAGGPPHCVNVPTVPLRIGPVVAVAQLDTGYDDSRQPFAVNINEALLQALQAAGVGLNRRPDISLQLSTCVAGVTETVEAWQPAPGTASGLLAMDGTLVPRGAGQLMLLVKRTPPAAVRCGGIGTWSQPAAQLGASFVASGAMVADPFSARVWVR